MNNEMRKEMNMEMAYEKPSIEVVEIVCQNTPDWTHGRNAVEF